MSPPVAIAGSLSGLRRDHAAHFAAVHARLRRAGVDTLLGDDASEPERAGELAAAWVQQGVRLVIGHFNSGCARAALPAYRAAGVELVLPASTADGLGQLPGVHQLCGDDSSQAEALVRWIARRWRTGDGVEVRCDGSDYARRLRTALEPRLVGRSTTWLELADPLPAQAPLCLVLALAPEAAAFAARPGLAAGRQAVVFADEAAVARVAHPAAASGVPCWIVTPSPSYTTLLHRAGALALRWLDTRSPRAGFGAWARATCALPPANGASGPVWRLRQARPTFDPTRQP
jgi:branched-chain amino acid transport system substrate-binding protein